MATATRIVGELLDFSRVQGAAPAPVEMAALVEEALERAAVPSTITVARRLAPDLPAMSVDREQISMAVSNLIGNAMLTMAEGGTLTLETARTGEGVSLAVGDSGPGIAPEDVGRIFEPFYATTVTGMGLRLLSSSRIS